MGYTSVKMENINPTANSTTNLRFELEQTTLQGEEIVVTASAVSFKNDQTSSVRNVSADQIPQLPIENVNQVIDNLNDQLSTCIERSCDSRLKYSCE